MAERVEVRIERLEGALDLDPPKAESLGAAGVDLRAAVAERVTLESGARRLIPTGVRVAIPSGWEGQVRPRSGSALREGLGIVNSPGTIDSDYRGEIGVILINFGDEPIAIERGDRIAQLVIAPVPHVVWLEAEISDDAGPGARGAGGFGSTGRS